MLGEWTAIMEGQYPVAVFLFFFSFLFDCIGWAISAGELSNCCIICVRKESTERHEYDAVHWH